jgi:hypothetical protein
MDMFILYNGFLTESVGERGVGDGAAVVEIGLCIRDATRHFEDSGLIWERIDVPVGSKTLEMWMW